MSTADHVVTTPRLRRLARELRAFGKETLQRIANVPRDTYAWIYTGLKLNRLFHAIGLSGAAQVRLIPSRLKVSRRLMHQPYRVPLELIRWGGRPAGGKARMGSGHGCGLVFGGAWDIEDKRDIASYLSDYIYSRTVIQLFAEGLPYQDTEQYREMSRLVKRGLLKEWQLRGCKSEADIARYFEALRATFEQIKSAGYKTQEQLGNPRWYDEIKVFVDRNGELHKHQGAGHHRLAMARLASVPSLPVLVVGVHREWALRVQREFGKDVITSIDLGLRRLERTTR